MEKVAGIEITDSYYSPERREELYKDLKIYKNEKGDMEIRCSIAVTLKISKEWSHLKAGPNTTLNYEE